MASEFTDISWPGWEVVRKIGEGSFGGVYEIQRTLPGGKIEKCALKRLSVPTDDEDINGLHTQSFGADSITAYYKDRMEKLVGEYSLMQSLNSCPNVVSCHDIRYVQHQDRIGWDIYIRMELLHPLKEALGSGYSEKTVIDLGTQLCNALSACHAENIIHRDIKPENILVSDKGIFKLGDFGVAKVSERTGTLTGSYGYMAPEVANHQHYGTSVDIYSLGMVLYWMMNRHTLPFLPLPPDIPTGVQRQQAQERRLSGAPLPPPADGSETLKQVVLKACAFSPAERYRSAEEMREALQRCARSSALKKHPVSEQTAAAQDAASALSPLAPLSPIPQQEAGREQEAPQRSMLTPPPPIPQQKAANDAPAQSMHTLSIQADVPRQKQQIPEQRGRAPEGNANMRRPGNANAKKPRRKKSAAGRFIAVSVIGIALLVCCWVCIFGYMHCWFGHVWQAADCTTGRICTRCSAIAEEPLGHKWQDATCTTPKTCLRCKATEGEALEHKWEAATCTTPKTCSRCNATEGEALEHAWEAATCTAPKTCSRCGATEGKELGHKWEAATCTKPQVCSRCNATIGIALGHKWEDATCTKPKTCSRCNATSGTALGHAWKSTTCTKPKTCSRCNATSGAAAGHSWQAATCTKPQTCSRCNATNGTARGHDWKQATCTKPKTCSRCNATSGAAAGHKWKAATYDAPETCRVCGVTRGTALKRTPSVKVKDIVTFGKYEQDNNKRNGTESIQWIVLDVQDDRALLLSRYALDSVRYHSSYVDVDWEDCTLRSWLNDTFLYEAFSADERRRILPTNNGYGYSSTSDSVFLLSVGEIYSYLPSARERTCSLTSYAISMGAVERNGVAQWWWTRSPGTASGQATFINFEGDSYSAYVNNYSLTVRPAIWISLD